MPQLAVPLSRALIGMLLLSASSSAWLGSTLAAARLDFGELRMPRTFDSPLLVQLPHRALRPWRLEAGNLRNRHTQVTPTEMEAFLKASRSQDGEDKYFVQSILQGNVSRHGVFVELGALDGLLFSNSYALEQAFGWSGVLIEPGPDNFGHLLKNRPLSTLVNMAVCSSPRHVHFLEKGPVGGIFEFASEPFKTLHWPGATAADGARIPCVPLSSLLRALDIKKVDFLSVDVEGGELEVLRTFDFLEVDVHCVVVEADSSNPQKDEQVRMLMKDNGYQHVGKVLRNDWFLRAK